MQGSRGEILNVPNLLSFYRLAMVPVIVGLALSEQRTLFVVFLCISFVTDVLDGPIARAWNMCTRFGARLDSIADELTYVAALVGVFQFEYRTLEPHIAVLYAFIGSLVVATLTPLIKFRTTPSFHLYSFKANSLLQGIFIFCLFVFGFNVYFYYFVMIFGVLACLELIAVALVVDEPVSDARSLYWVLDKSKRGQ
jgi:CDP-diacylglycerol--glycerol-3-phosphate 3-phosphatidyltransferase